jgi:hypothetical protein
MVERIVPLRLVSFAERVVRQLDSKDPDAFVDADDAVQTSYASGGRTGDNEFFIAYRSSRRETWYMGLDEHALRRLASGVVSTVDVEASAKVVPEPRVSRGDAFVLWGELDAERAMITTDADIDTLVTWLHARSCSRSDGVATAVFGSTFGDYVYLAIAASGYAYVSVVLRSGDRYAVAGDAAQVELQTASFPWLSAPVPLTHGDYVPLASVRNAIVRLVLSGRRDRHNRWTSAMYSVLLHTLPMLLAERQFIVPLAVPFQPLTASEVKLSSITPERSRTRFAETLVDTLVAQNAIELTGIQGGKSLCSTITALLENSAYLKPFRLMDLLLRDANVAEVFIDENELNALVMQLLDQVSLAAT